MPRTTEVEEFLQAIAPFYQEVGDTVTTETTAEETHSQQTESEPPLKPTNQIADEEGEGSGSESDESVDFKDSFQEFGVNTFTHN